MADYDGTDYVAADLHLTVPDGSAGWDTKDLLRSELHEIHQQRIKDLEATVANGVEGTWTAVEASYSPGDIPTGTMVIGSNGHTFRLLAGDGSVDPVSMTYTDGLSNVDGSSGTQWRDIDFVQAFGLQAINSATALAINTDYRDSSSSAVTHTLPLLSSVSEGDIIDYEKSAISVVTINEHASDGSDEVATFYEPGNGGRIRKLGGAWVVTNEVVTASGRVGGSGDRTISGNGILAAFAPNPGFNVFHDTADIFNAVTTDIEPTFKCEIDLKCVLTVSAGAELVKAVWIIRRTGTDLYLNANNDNEARGTDSRRYIFDPSTDDGIELAARNTNGTARDLIGDATDHNETQMEWRILRRNRT